MTSCCHICRYFLTRVFPLPAPSPLRWYIYFKTQCLRAFLQSSPSSVGSPDNTVNERNSLGNLIHIRAGAGGLRARWRMTEFCWVRDDAGAEWSQRPTIVCLPTCPLLSGLVYMCPLPRTLRHACSLLPLLFPTPHPAPRSSLAPCSPVTWYPGPGPARVF